MTDGGGFDPNDKMPSEGEEHKPVRTEEALIPVTIRQIYNSLEDSPNDPPIINGQPRKYVSLVGMITEVSEDNISIIYEIDDGTGQFRIQDYTHSDQDTNLSASFEENSYIYVVGRIKQGNKESSTPPFITAFSVKQVTDPNQIAFHNLQALYVNLFSTRGLPQNSAYEKAVTQGTSTNSGQNAGMRSSDQTIRNNDVTLSNEDLVKDAVINFIKQKNQDYGVHIDEIRKALSNKFKGEDVDQAVEVLAYNGEIYAAAEQDHYAIC